MAPHSSTLAWKILWMEEPGWLQSMWSQRVRHNWATSLSLFTFMHWRRKWQPTPVFLPGESQGWGSLAGCRPWGCTESDMTEAAWQQQQDAIILGLTISNYTTDNFSVVSFLLYVYSQFMFPLPERIFFLIHGLTKPSTCKMLHLKAEYSSILT